MVEPAFDPYPAGIVRARSARRQISTLQDPVAIGDV